MTIRLDAHKPEFHRAAPPQLPVRVATTGTLTISTGLNAGDTVDGVTLAAGDRVLVKDQSTGAQNGIYVAGASPARAFDFEEGVAAYGALIWVVAGTANGQTLWVCTNTTVPTIGSTALTFAEFTPGAGGGTDTGIALFLDHGTVGATETIDQSAAVAHWITLDVNCTLTFSGAVSTVDGDPVECAFTLYVEQDGSGGNTITWPGSVQWPDGSVPTLDTSAGAVEVLTFSTVDGGTTWYGFHGGTGSGSALSDNDPEDVGTAPDPGVDTEGSRSDHVHAMDPTIITSLGFRGEILISDTPSNPLVFADLLQNDDGDDLLYADL